MLYVLTTDTTIDMVPSDHPSVALHPGWEHLGKSTRLVPLACCSASHGAPVFRVHAISAIEMAEVTAAESTPRASNMIAVRKGFVALDGQPIEPDRLTDAVAFLVALAIIQISEDPAAFLHPTLPE